MRSVFIQRIDFDRRNEKLTFTYTDGKQVTHPVKEFGDCVGNSGVDVTATLEGLSKFIQAGIVLTNGMKGSLDINYRLPITSWLAPKKFEHIVEHAGPEYIDEYILAILPQDTEFYGDEAMIDTMFGSWMSLLLTYFIPKWGNHFKHKELAFTTTMSLLKRPYRFKMYKYYPTAIAVFVETFHTWFDTYHECNGRSDELWDELFDNFYHDSENNCSYSNRALQINSRRNLQHLLANKWQRRTLHSTSLLSSEQLERLENTKDFRCDNAWLRHKLYNHPQLHLYPKLTYAVNYDVAMTQYLLGCIVKYSGLPEQLVKFCVVPFV